MSETKFKIGLGLSGGGSRGAAHVGVLKAFEEAGIVPQVIAGTSAGAIVGSLYAAGVGVDEIFSFIKSSNLFKAYRLSFPSNGLTNFKYLSKKLGEFIEEDAFEKLKIPLHVGTTNLETGKMEVFSSGQLFKVVQAAGSIPLFFKPVEINGQLYVDGGAMNNFPVQAIRDHCELLVGVNLMPIVPVERKKIRSFFGVALRSVYLGIEMNSLAGKALCDILIEPPELYQYDIFRFNKVEEMYKIGYDYAQKAIPEIVDRLGKIS